MQNRGTLTDSPDGTNRDALTKEHLYTALVTPDWLENIGCTSESREASGLGCKMIKFQMKGVVLPKELEELNWLKTFWFTTDDDFKKTVEEFYAWLEMKGW